MEKTLSDKRTREFHNWWYSEEDVKEFIDIILRHITRQNFDGSTYTLKGNLLNYIKEKSGKDLI